MNLSIPQDAFSDGQVRSKLWLANSLNDWSEKHFNLNEKYTLTWYGSWVGVGPLLLLSMSRVKFDVVNLIEVDAESLQTSKQILSHWKFNGVNINTIHEDMNSYSPSSKSPFQLFVNTACEHVSETEWLKKIPDSSKILLQSTNMVHPEHINLSHSLEDFKNKTATYFSVLEESQMDVDYGTMSFSRYMLIGEK